MSILNERPSASGSPRKPSCKANLLVPFMRAVIEEADCECKQLYEASPDAIAQVCTMLHDELYEVEDQRNADYLNVLARRDNEELATFIGSILYDAMSLLSLPNEDRQSLLGICYVNARRVVSEAEYTRLLRRR
jgi:hypothetical protein